MSESCRMDPAEVPADLLELYRLASMGHSVEESLDPGRYGLAAVLPEHERQVRARVAEEILADVEPYFAARINPDMWEATYRAAWVARGES